MSKRWNFTGLLLASYLAVFHLWMVMSAGWRIASTAIVAGALLALLARAARRGWFLNRLDLGLHACVVLDIGLEGFLISVHDDFGFYFCAFGFAAVIGGYRVALLRKQLDPPGQTVSSDPAPPDRSRSTARRCFLVGRPKPG